MNTASEVKDYIQFKEKAPIPNRAVLPAILVIGAYFCLLVHEEGGSLLCLVLLIVKIMEIY